MLPWLMLQSGTALRCHLHGALRLLRELAGTPVVANDVFRSSLLVECARIGRSTDEECLELGVQIVN
jgi:hypothetical protein